MPGETAESAFDKFLLRRINRAIGEAPVRLVFSKEDVAAADGAGKETIVIHDRRVLASLALDPEIGFGDAYMKGRIEVRGDLVRVLEIAMPAMHRLK
ncbi:MAG TPA: hypothetical protein VLV89_00960, partial [Candidatus Acidoferrum sp.]|nr:hypothetical protein [Candidatus Acidoferrum sp.]